jgi:plasmid stabilization system protein ParE
MDQPASGFVRAYVLTATARRDLEEIWKYIARDSVDYADLVEEAVYAACRFAAANPELGHRRRDVTKADVLFLAVRGYEVYSIAYLADSDPLTVVRVVHGARDLPRLFRRRFPQ